MPAIGLQVLLLVALYGFLGMVLVFLWQDERRAARGAPAPPPAHLLSLEDERPKSFPLTSSNLLGRSADNAICLDDPLVSAHHARISFAGGQWLVEDLGSRNGTLVNDLRVESPIALAPGDILRIGGLSLRFESGAAPAPASDGRAPSGAGSGGADG
jgi:pSer/pThr/pTyr-binding forkhead associated (FHA) protein